jgi:hypothetical protein
VPAAAVAAWVVWKAWATSSPFPLMAVTRSPGPRRPGLRRATIPPVTVSKARLCVIALFVALLVGACGSGGDDGLSGAKAEYVAQIDPICTELQAKIGDLGDNPEQQAKDVEAAVVRMKGVSMPRDDEAFADRYIAAMENLYLSLQDIDQARRVNDQPRAQRAVDGARANAKDAAKAAEEYGMVVCAEEL